jgi:hypothetical protein
MANDPPNPPPKRHPWVPIICVVLVWAAVGIDIYSRPVTPDGQILSYGGGAPSEFHAVVQFKDWTKYTNYKAMLVVRTVFSDRDRATDDWIAKSIPYTIEGPVLNLVAINSNQMRFAAAHNNYIEHDFAVIPAGIGAEQIRNLGDVTRLGGKILATAVLGGVQGGPLP